MADDLAEAKRHIKALLQQLEDRMAAGGFDSLSLSDERRSARAFLSRKDGEGQTVEGDTLTVPCDADDDIPHTVGRNRRTYRLVPMEEPEQSAEGDNHHNAARCPYCQPTLEADRETLRRTVIEACASEAAHRVRICADEDNWEGQREAEEIERRIRAMAEKEQR